MSNLYSLRPGFDDSPEPRCGLTDGANNAQDTGRSKQIQIYEVVSLQNSTCRVMYINEYKITEL